jgi:hypothetical protein
MNYLDEIKNDVLQRILIVKHNAKISDVKLIALLNERADESDTPLHRNTVNDWKNSKSASFMEYIDDIAEFTKTSVDYLIGRNNSEFPLDTQPPLMYDEHDKQLLLLFHELNREGKRAALAHAEFLAGQSDYKKLRPHEAEA